MKCNHNSNNALSIAESKQPDLHTQCDVAPRTHLYGCARRNHAGSPHSCKRRARSDGGNARVGRALMAGVAVVAAFSSPQTCDAFGGSFASTVRRSVGARRSGGGARVGGVTSSTGSRPGAGFVTNSRMGGGLTGSSKPVLQQRSTRWRGNPRSERAGGRGGLTVVMSSSLEAGLGDLFKAPDERILKAVEKAGNRAVPSDVATLAGVDLNAAKAGLVNLANLVGGDLEVSKDGDVVYNFPNNFRASLLQKSAYRRVVEAVRGAWPVIFYGIRVSFGVVLLASIALIFSTIFFAATYANSSSDSRDDRRGRGGGGYGGGGMGFNTYFGPSPFDFFYYRPYYGYYNTPVRQRGDPGEMGLFESIFSYIFGDGDPNGDIESRRLESAATLIRGNGGAVSAEQLAPILSPGNPRGDESRVDESFVLPILTALDGAPEVTEDGDIVYVFPSLQTSAIADAGTSNSRRELERLQGLKSLSTADLRVALNAVGLNVRTMFERSEMVDAAMQAGIAKRSDGRIVLEPVSNVSRGRGGAVERATIIPEPLEEEERPFSVAAEWKKIAAGVLGAVNLGGALYLQNLLSGPALAGVALPGVYGFVQGAMPFLLTYAVGFNLIPVGRWLLNKRANSKIAERNMYRRQWATVGKNGGVEVDRKLKAAKSMTTALKVIKAEDVEYTTAKSLTDQNISNDNNLLDDFDTRLKSGTDKSGQNNAIGGAGSSSSSSSSSSDAGVDGVDGAERKPPTVN